MLDFLHIDVSDFEVEHLTDSGSAESHDEDITFFYSFFLHITDLVHSRSSCLFSLSDRNVVVNHFSTLTWTELVEDLESFLRGDERVGSLGELG